MVLSGAKRQCQSSASSVANSDKTRRRSRSSDGESLPCSDMEDDDGVDSLFDEPAVDPVVHKAELAELFKSQQDAIFAKLDEVRTTVGASNAL
eukprot:8436875-Karenia_brevis.AAC.1